MRGLNTAGASMVSWGNINVAISVFCFSQPLECKQSSGWLGPGIVYFLNRAGGAGPLLGPERNALTPSLARLFVAGKLEHEGRNLRDVRIVPKRTW